MNRRDFYKMLASQFVVFIDELRGKPQLRLDEIEKLPDSKLGKIIPKVLPKVEIIVSEKEICARLPGEKK